MPFHPVEPVRAYQQIAEQIERAVINGEYEPGDRLPSERELVEQFQVGRSSVREALRVLESADLVKSRLGDPRGPQVMPVSAHPLRKTLARFAAIEHGNFAALVQFRMIVEGAANLLAAQYRTDEHLHAMEQVNARMRAHLGADLDQFSEADFEFHQVVARASGNPLLEVCGDAVRETALALMRSKLADATDHCSQMRNSVHHHEQVLGAIREQDGPKAAWLARERLYAYYCDYVDEQDQPGLRALVDEGYPA
ncbi:FadR/GntR family transcriptional regulator [Salinifilum aidingensis]